MEGKCKDNEALERINKLEKRLNNAEYVIVGLQAVLNEALPPFAAESIARMVEDFFNASKSFGGFSAEGFSCSDEDNEEETE